MKFRVVKIGELYEVHNGLSKGRQYFGEGFPFLSFSTVFNNWFLPDSLSDLVKSSEKEQESYSIHRGDIFITRTSETMDELGMSSVALKDYPKATYNGFVKRLRPIDDRVLPEYIGYYLRTPNFRSKFMSLTGSMISRASLRNESLLDMEILLPSIDDQKEIADKIGAYDKLIANNSKAISLLKESCRRIYDLYEFEKFSFCSLSDLDCRLESGRRPSGGIGNLAREWVPSVGAENVIDIGKYNFDSEKYVSREFYENMKTGKIRNKDILIYKDGAYIGKTSLFQDDFPHKHAAVNEHVFLLHANDDVYQYYLYFTLSQHQYYQKMQNLNSNSAQPGLNRSQLLGLEIPMPTFSVVKEFNDYVSAFVSEIFVLAKENKFLEDQKNIIMTKLFSTIGMSV